MVDFSSISARFLGADDADYAFAAPDEDHPIDLCVDPAEGDETDLATVFPVVDPLQNLVGEDFGSGQVRDAMLSEVGAGLLFVPFEPQVPRVTPFQHDTQCVHVLLKQPLVGERYKQGNEGNKMKRIVYVAIALLGISNFALEGQFVGKGPFDAKYCDKVEPLKPNLVLSSTTHIHGTLVDGSGAPFVLSKIEVRRYISTEEQTFLKVVTTDKSGNFDLGQMDVGKFRVLASESRGFEQPNHLVCTQAECKLDIRLKANATDLPTYACPIR
jgi:hypothetical protein